MELQLIIDKDEVIDKASELCSIIAYRNGDYASGAPTSNTKSLVMSQYFTEGLSTLLSVGARFDPIVYEDAIAFVMPDRFNMHTAPAIQQAAENYLVNDIVRKWTSVISKEDSEQYAAVSTSHLEQFNQMLNARKSPARKQLKYGGI